MKIILFLFLFSSYLFSSETPQIPLLKFPLECSSHKKSSTHRFVPNFINTNRERVSQLSTRNEEKNNKVLVQENSNLRKKIFELESGMGFLKNKISVLEGNYKILEKSKLKKNQGEKALFHSSSDLTSVSEIDADENEELSEVCSEDCQLDWKQQIERLNNEILLFRESDCIKEKRIQEYEAWFRQSETDETMLQEENQSLFAELEAKITEINEMASSLEEVISEKEKIDLKHNSLFKEYEELVLRYELLAEKEKMDASVQTDIIKMKRFDEKLKLISEIVTIEVKPEKAEFCREIFIQEFHDTPEKRSFNSVFDDLGEEGVSMLSGPGQQFVEYKKPNFEIINDVISVVIENKIEKKTLEEGTQTEPEKKIEDNLISSVINKNKKLFLSLGFISLIATLFYLKKEKVIYWYGFLR